MSTKSPKSASQIAQVFGGLSLTCPHPITSKMATKASILVVIKIRVMLLQNYKLLYIPLSKWRTYAWSCPLASQPKFRTVLSSICHCLICCCETPFTLLSKTCDVGNSNILNKPENQDKVVYCIPN